MVSLLYDNHGVIIVSQPDSGVGTRRATAHHDDIAGNRVDAALGACRNPLHEKRSQEAGAPPHVTVHCR